MNIVVLERSSVGMDVSIDSFNELGNVTAYNNTSFDEIAERIKDADIVVANKSRLNEETLKDAKNVKLICEFATGFDNVDVEYCKSRGIGVCNVRDYSTDMVAQHTFAMALFLSEKLSYYDTFVKSGKYAEHSSFSYFNLPFYELAGKTWGIIGMGNIGRKVARIASAFGCRVIFYSVTGKSSVTEYERVDFDTTTMIVNPKTGKTSIAKLHPQDKYVPYIGLAVAWAKYKGLTVPTVAEELKSYKDLKFGDIFIVKSNIVPTYIYVGTERSQFVIARQNRSSDEELVTFSANNNTFYRVGNILNKRE